MLKTDTLFYDADKIAQYQSESQYDYNSQLVQRNVNLIDMFKEWFRNLLRQIFNSDIADKYSDLILIVLILVVILLLVFLVYKKRPELFYRAKKLHSSDVLEEETIYGVDFSKEIALALGKKDFYMAVRMAYLQTLKYLSDHHHIDWQTYKTPTEYLYEMNRKEVKEEFKGLTNCFLLVRYGNFEATEETYRTVKNLQQVILKGGNSEG